MMYNKIVIIAPVTRNRHENDNLLLLSEICLDQNNCRDDQSFVVGSIYGESRRLQNILIALAIYSDVHCSNIVYNVMYKLSSYKKWSV